MKLACHPSTSVHPETTTDPATLRWVVSGITLPFAGLGLELGGKDPAYVRADANLDHAIENLADGAFFNSGQSCCGIERIYVDRRLFDDFVAGVAEIARGHVLNNPLDPATTLGPMVGPAAAQAVRDQIAAATAAGARALVDRASFARDDGAGAYLAPQVLIDVDHDMAVMREESFGPVVGVMPVSRLCRNAVSEALIPAKCHLLALSSQMICWSLLQ